MPYLGWLSLIKMNLHETFAEFFEEENYKFLLFYCPKYMLKGVAVCLKGGRTTNLWQIASFKEKDSNGITSVIALW